MDKDKIKSEILQAENDLIATYRQGDFMKTLFTEVKSPEFRSIVNGKIDTYETLEDKYRKLTMDKAVKSMDYKIESQDFNFINTENVLVTLVDKLTTTMSDGTAFTRPLAETILWQRVENKWRIGHYHATEIPKGN